MEILIKFAMFFLAGGVGFAGDILIATALLRTKKFHLLVANTIGFLIGVIIKYFINRIWTFRSTDPDMAAQFAKFMGISLIGLIMVNGIVYYLHKKRGKKFMFSKIIAMSVFMVWNFVANYYFTFTH